MCLIIASLRVIRDSSRKAVKVRHDRVIDCVTLTEFDIVQRNLYGFPENALYGECEKIAIIGLTFNKIRKVPGGSRIYKKKKSATMKKAAYLL